MGKNNKKRKHALFHAAKARANELDAVAPGDGNDGNLPAQFSAVASKDSMSAEKDDAHVSEADLAITLRTLERLAETPGVFHSKRFKDLRRTLHPLVLEQLQSYDRGADYRQKATHALQYHHWSDAMAALQACRDFRQLPKQGTIQRWVRDCTEAGAVRTQLLQAILRVSDRTECSDNIHDAGQALAEQLAKPGVRNEFKVLEPWKWWTEGDELKEEQNKDKKANEHPPTVTAPSTVEIKSQVIYRENAAERTPPNRYDLLLHATEPGGVEWETPSETVAAHSVPFLPDPARVLSHVLSPNECRRLLDIMTTLGYRPDHPTALESPTGIDSCEWMIDSSISDVVFERVKPCLPSILTLPGGGSSSRRVRLHSLNPRWRGFRYCQECVYRPHLDGSWPRSFVDPEGRYSCPKNGDIKSYLTFLIYLNDDFEGGETRFYCPDGVARGIVPKQGCATVFPQGNLESLIHEGSRVTRGTKYVVRTDVLYQPTE